MIRPIRNATEARGYDPAKHNLVSFGGAGGQRACAIAERLAIENILIHKHSSLLSAYGISKAQLQAEVRAPYSGIWSPTTFAALRARAEGLKHAVLADLVGQGATASSAALDVTTHMRYFGTDTTLSISSPRDNDYARAFTSQHTRKYAFTMDRKIVVDAISVRGTASSVTAAEEHVSYRSERERAKSNGAQGISTVKQTVYLNGQWLHVPVSMLSQVERGTQIAGPAIMINATQTILMQASFMAYVLSDHIIMEKSGSLVTEKAPATMDAVHLSVFAHRLMSIAEQMGNTLQRTSISSSIRERLDFSCAIFSPDGKLIANAPHTPIHLGSMQFAIQAQHRHWEGRLEDGDFLLTDPPEWGGTHLPDLTVVTPCFINRIIAFYVASRGHHTDIGGKGVTSMMPGSKMMWEEGISVESMKIATGGKFLENAVRDAFSEAGSKPGCAPTRRISDNTSDLEAQMSANQRGLSLLKRLCDEAGVVSVHQAMEGIQGNAESADRTFLQALAKSRPGPLTAIDHYDDGTPIKIQISIDPDIGSATFDFDGTGPQVWSNFNSPISI